MARPKNEIEKAYVGLRMDERLLAAVDSFAELTKSNRSQIVVDAVANYLETRKCEVCGAIIPKNSKFCPCCGNKLYTREEIFNVAKTIRDRIIKEKNLQIGEIDGGMYSFYPLEEIWEKDHLFRVHLSTYMPNGEVLTPVFQKGHEFYITMDEIINELNGNSYTVDITDKKKADVKITVEKVKCPKCGNLNYPDKIRCDTCDTTLNKELAETEKNLSEFMINELMKRDKQNKK